MEIRLTPKGTLSLMQTQEPTVAQISALAQTFQHNWCEGLFVLGAEKIDAASIPTFRYWREFAELYLTALCHIPSTEKVWHVEPLTSDVLARLQLSAPPMVGGEYLSPAMLNQLWTQLDTWVHEAVSNTDSLATFLHNKAPQWNQVGRVCFHLAENKQNPDIPFAFLATYATGIGASGQVKYLPLGQALQEYAGTQNRSRLIKLLEPVQKAMDACSWVKHLVDSGSIYTPIAWSSALAYQFLLSIPLLEQSGLMVRIPDWWKKRPRPRISVKIGDQITTSLNADTLLDFDITVALGDHSLTQEEWESLLHGGDGLVWFKGQWVEVDREKLREALEHWRKVQKTVKDGVMSFTEGMRLLAGTAADLKQNDQLEKERDWVHVQAGATLRSLLENLRNPQQIKSIQNIPGLRATLRPYQQDGVAWLALLSQLGLGACLADDMGLGKTIQILALLLHLKQTQSRDTYLPSLLVIPASLLGNWKREAERFAPQLQLLLLHSAEISRKELDDIATEPQRFLAQQDLVITTYTMLSRQEWLFEQPWNLAILDEAQAIKNPSSGQTKAAKKIQSRANIALTGTPVENRLGDLWSIFDFINPGLLGTSKVFKSFTQSLQSRTQDAFAPLRKLVSPYILRRMKTDPAVISDLPEKTEIHRYCNLTKTQVKIYQNIVETMAEALHGPNAANGIARKGLILQVMMRLKQVCNHPSQVLGDFKYEPAESGKFLQVEELCSEIAARQEKVLIFTQFREIIDPLHEHLCSVFQRRGLVLHGGTSVKQRKSLVDEFQHEHGSPFFILSLKAGGTGLNLTAASHVIHFDRWWNPAVENQATDRAFRIGQKNNVLVHKFVTTGTIEERIDALISEKQKLANEILAGEDEIKITELDNDALLQLIQLDVTRATF